MKYQEVLNRLNRNGGLVEGISTLGKRSTIHIKISDNSNAFILINTSNIEYHVSEYHWNETMERIDYLRKNKMGVYMTGNYGLPKWKNCPETVICPYLPAIKFYIEGKPL